MSYGSIYGLARTTALAKEIRENVDTPGPLERSDAVTVQALVEVLP